MGSQNKWWRAHQKDLSSSSKETPFQPLLLTLSPLTPSLTLFVPIVVVRGHLSHEISGFSRVTSKRAVLVQN
ncbi:hypothetical protein Nepgr_000768 [Nepenthes gracilis]|uniref:Uncharacterized protein n=1 Tax=Nepenthes gracilis TaxID=150966 RepID=A0AAD3P704_NEPGR|nr:hypothetical protein Nepgr_000768 [Nepenthes gracilis]